MRGSHGRRVSVRCAPGGTIQNPAPPPFRSSGFAQFKETTTRRGPLLTSTCHTIVGSGAGVAAGASVHVGDADGDGAGIEDSGGGTGVDVGPVDVQPIAASASNATAHLHGLIGQRL